MRDISVFDVIGPNMIGPSSSHTAGALRIARMAQAMVQSKIRSVRFILYGSFARTYKGHGTDRALLAGILGYGPEDLRIRNSYTNAEEAGIEYRFDIDTANQDVHPNTVEIVITEESGRKLSVVGESIGGGSAVLKRLNGIDIALSGEYQTLLVEQRDEPGVLAYITACLGEEQINIAFLRMYRENRGEAAYTVIEVDGEISEGVVDKVKQHPAVGNVTLIQL